jgi:hypothetical protein
MTTPNAAPAKPKHLLDVNVLLAGIWQDHPDHARVIK